MKDSSFSLLFGERGKVICEKILSIHKRFPRLIPNFAMRGLGIFLSHCPDLFLNERSPMLLCRIFFSLYRLHQKARTPLAQRIDLKVIKIRPAVCGISVAISPLYTSEIFQDKHIFKAIQNLIPGTVLVSHSYLSYTSGGVSLYYLEINKMRGGVFSKEDLKKLQNLLHFEFHKEIEPTDHPLIFPGNEEELFKNIRHLSQEIKHTLDLPQVMITFVQYSRETLKFLVIVSRVIKKDTPSLTTLAARLPSFVSFSLENTLSAGMLRRKYPKEASIFTLEVNSSLFSRNQHTVNLRSARFYIVKALESMLGPFRDYNGGLLHKENEQLLAIKRSLDAKGISAPYLEDLFYNIKPISRRTLLSVETGVQLITSFQKMLATPLESGKSYRMHTYSFSGARLAIIKTSEKHWKVTLPAKVLASIAHAGCAVVEREGLYYLCFFHQHADNDHLFDTLLQEMTQTRAAQLSNKKILHINFQGGDPLSLNPQLATDMQSHILSNMLFEGLTRRSSAGTIEPAAAEKIEVSNCGKEYTFYLRHASWSNGEEVTAYHFEKAWKKALQRYAIGFPYPEFFFPIRNAKQVIEKTTPIDQVGIVSENAKTLRVTLEAPCPYFLDLLTIPQFFPIFGEAEEPSYFNGPFTVSHWHHGSALYLSQNPFYRDAHNIHLGGIQIAMVRDPHEAYQMFQKGELDFIGDPISPLPPEILMREEVKPQLVHQSVSRIFWIHCNSRSSPLNNVHFRRALSLSINRKQLTDTVFIEQTPHISPFPIKYASLQGNQTGDVEEARREFEIALAELKLDKAKLPPIQITHSDLSFEKPLFDELQKQWKETLGITIVPQALRWNDFSNALEKGNFQLAGLFRRDLFNNPLFYLSIFKPSQKNPHSLENPEFSTLLDQFYKGESPDHTLRKIEHLLVKEVPIIPLINQKYLALISKNIKGLRWDENGCLNLKEVELHGTRH